jgi:hypothetical protein
MSSTLFEAPQYNPEKERKRKQAIWAAIVIVLILAGLAYRYRNWPQERAVDHFFAALQQKDYEKAYGIWMADPQWKEHPKKFAQYPYEDFYRDWGPGGDWGIIKSHKVLGSERTKSGSGVVVVIDVNDRADKARLFYDLHDNTLTFSPV